MCERGLRGTGCGGGVVSVVLHVELLLLSKNMNEYEFVFMYLRVYTAVFALYIASGLALSIP